MNEASPSSPRRASSATRSSGVNAATRAARPRSTAEAVGLRMTLSIRDADPRLWSPAAFGSVKSSSRATQTYAPPVDGRANLRAFMSLAPGMRIGPPRSLPRLAWAAWARCIPQQPRTLLRRASSNPSSAFLEDEPPPGEQERRAGDDAVPTSARRRGAPGEAGRRRSVHPHRQSSTFGPGWRSHREGP